MTVLLTLKTRITVSDPAVKGTQIGRRQVVVPRLWLSRRRLACYCLDLLGDDGEVLRWHNEW